MRRLLAATVSLVLTASGATAAIQSGNATFTNVDYAGDTSLFAQIGADVTTSPPPDLTLEWAYDPADVWTSNEVPGRADRDELRVVSRYHYGLAFTVKIGGVPVIRSAASGANRMMVSDGTFDAPGGTDHFLDEVRFFNNAVGEIGSTGVTANSLVFYQENADEGALDGTGLPDAGEFAALGTGSALEYAGISLFKRDVQTGEIVARASASSRDGSLAVTPIPLPGSLAMLGLGLAGMGAWRRAQRIRAAG